jgi:predicted thioredoxin/glutaredoxin
MFRYCEEFSRYVAPLELDVILEIPFWRKGDNDEITQCTQNIENGFRELSLHGKEIYDEWSTKMVESLRLNCQRDMMVPKYTSVLSETLNQLAYMYDN